MEFKDKVKYVRAQLSLTQKELANLIGVDYCTVNKWENGSNPQILKSQKFYQFSKSRGIDFDKFEIITAKPKPHVEKVNAKLRGDYTMSKFLKQFIDCYRVSGASDDWLAGWSAGIAWCKERIDEVFKEPDIEG